MRPENAQVMYKPFFYSAKTQSLAANKLFAQSTLHLFQSMAFILFHIIIQKTDVAQFYLSEML